MNYRAEIDGLRAIAVVAVIINHFHKPLLPSGYLGVDVFFVISGFVITASLANRRSSSLGDFLAGFYERRLKRLVPALALFVLITSLFTCLFNPEPLQSLQIGARSLIGISNLSLYKASTDYFGEEVELNSFVHTWSLGVEEQFYLLFPLLVWFTGFGRQTAGGRRWLLVTIGGLARDEALWFGVRSLVPATLSWLRVYRHSHPELFTYWRADALHAGSH